MYRMPELLAEGMIDDMQRVAHVVAQAGLARSDRDQCLPLAVRLGGLLIRAGCRLDAARRDRALSFAPSPCGHVRS